MTFDVRRFTRRIATSFSANPVIGRELSIAFTGPRLGAAFLFVNLVLAVTYLCLCLFFFESDSWEEQSRTGWVVYFFHFVVLYSLLSILGP